MTMKTDEILTDEKLQDIYTSEKFRNQVATAHWRANSQGVKQCQITCSYPVTYIVSPEQIETAQKEKERAKKEVLENIGNKLVFVGMGMTYDKSEFDDIGNYRIRTEFINRQGNKFFIELGHLCYHGKVKMRNDDLSLEKFARIDHAIDRTKQDKLQDSHHRQGEFYNYKNLERQSAEMGIAYNSKGILALINKHFDCNFTELAIDNYNLSTQDFVCVSPE